MKMNSKKYTMKNLKKIMPKRIVKQFICTPLMWKKTGEKATCAIKGCNEEVRWVTTDKKENFICLCFGHGEDL